jgi:hypothetical protein
MHDHYFKQWLYNFGVEFSQPLHLLKMPIDYELIYEIVAYS